MDGDDQATRVLAITRDFGDRFAAVTAWRVPESERYPEGIKYSMQYGTDGGETILRYDNFPDHPGVTRHHRHTPTGAVEPIEFRSLRALYDRFKREVNEYGDEWD